MTPTRASDPVTTLTIERLKTDDGKPRVEWAGLSKREYFATCAFNAMLVQDSEMPISDAAMAAVDAADALIAELNVSRDK